MNQESAERLYALALRRAKNEWGEPAWRLLGRRIRRALIAEEVLTIAAGQDDTSVPAAKVRDIVEFGFGKIMEEE
jgi:hypothetical protein